MDTLPGPFDTLSGYRQAIDCILSSASRELCIFDRDLEKTGLGSRQYANRLSAFLAGGRDRMLRIVLHDTEHVMRYSPRLMTLLKRYSHNFIVRQSSESLRSLSDCFILADSTSGVIRFHEDHFRGKLLLGQSEEIHAWHQRFEDLWTESVPGIAATHLGL